MRFAKWVFTVAGIWGVVVLMIPAMFEKLGYVAMLIVMRAQSRISALDAQPAWPDLVLGLLFVAAFVKTRPE